MWNEDELHEHEKRAGVEYGTDVVKEAVTPFLYSGGAVQADPGLKSTLFRRMTALFNLTLVSERALLRSGVETPALPNGQKGGTIGRAIAGQGRVEVVGTYGTWRHFLSRQCVFCFDINKQPRYK